MSRKQASSLDDQSTAGNANNNSQAMGAGAPVVAANESSVKTVLQALGHLGKLGAVVARSSVSTTYAALPTKSQIAKSDFVFCGKQLTGASWIFLGRMMAESEAPPILSDAFHMMWKDILPMMLLQVAYSTASYLLSPEEPSYYNPLHWAASLMMLFLWVGSSIVMKRQQIRFLTHSLVCTIAYPSKFDQISRAKKLTKEQEERHAVVRTTALKNEKGKYIDVQIDNSVSRKDSTMRVIKGEIVAFIVYLTATFANSLMAYIPYVGWLMAAASQIKLNGETLLEWRLANDKISNRFRCEYFHQHVSVSVLIGLAHKVLSWLMTRPLMFVPGLAENGNDSVMFGRCTGQFAIEGILLFCFMGITHFMALPKPVEKATQHFYDPLAVIRKVMGFLIDIFTPGLRNVFNGQVQNQVSKKADPKKALVKSKSLDGFSSVDVATTQYEKFRLIVKDNYNNQWIDQILAILMPTSLRGFAKAKEDKILAPYWSEVFLQLVSIIESLQKYQNIVLTMGRAKDGYDALLKPFEEYLGLALKAVSFVFTPFGLLVSAVSNTSEVAGFFLKHNPEARDLAQLLSGVPYGVALLVLRVMREQKLMEDLEELQKWLQARIDEHAAGRVEMLPSSAPSSAALALAAASKRKNGGRLPPSQSEENLEWDDSGYSLNKQQAGKVDKALLTSQSKEELKEWDDSGHTFNNQQAKRIDETTLPQPATGVAEKPASRHAKLSAIFLPPAQGSSDKSLESESRPRTTHCALAYAGEPEAVF